MKRQLFVLPADVFDALSPQEVNATVEAMKELGIYRLPYPEVDVWLPANKHFGWKITSVLKNEGISLEELREDAKGGLFALNEAEDQYRPAEGSGFVFIISRLSLESDTLGIAIFAMPGTPAAAKFKCKAATESVWQKMPLARDAVANALIVLLATRNASKTTRENKLAKLGIGRGKRPGSAYRYVTTISLPTQAELDKEPADLISTPGKAKRPHLRRGHIRRQHYGPKRALVRQQWIEPVFVNADKDWVDKRERYNVSL